MNAFSDIKEIILTLQREQKLLSEMFIKRKSLSYKREYALEMVDYQENRVQYLIDHSVLRSNGSFLEIDDLYLNFFEHILEVNEEINISYINENIQGIKDNIIYYFNEKNENRKYNYLKFIKNSFRKIGKITLRNIVDLKRNVDNTFKNEPNYNNKKAKLENLDQKRVAIFDLIKQTETLIYNDEYTFFSSARDEELEFIIIDLKLSLRESVHNLIEIEKQIIDFLNQIKYQSGVVEKIRQIKYLKDEFTIKSSTNLVYLLNESRDVIFETAHIYPVKISLDFLNNDSEVIETIKKVADKFKDIKGTRLPVADKISNEYLETQIEEEILIDLYEVKNNFIASGNNLFDFVSSYDFLREVPFDERVTIYCQLVSQFENDLAISNVYQSENEIEYCMIYPK